MALPRLSEGILPQLFDGAYVEGPIVQILGVKFITNDHGRKYRFLLSDGKHGCQSCIMIDEHKEMLVRGELEKFGIIRLKKYSISRASADRTVLIIHQLECLVKGADVKKKIGDPQNYDVSQGQVATGPSNGFQSARSESVALSSSGRNGYQAESSTRDSFGLNDLNIDDRLIHEKIVIPITNITADNGWSIRGRCTDKTHKRSYEIAGGEESLFSFTLQDGTGDIKITTFKHECDCLHDHNYEITLSSNSVLRLKDESKSSCQAANNFVNANDIETFPKLSEGILPRLFNGENFEGPIVQILAVKSITSDQGKRYRFLLSDGVYSSQLCIMMDEHKEMLERDQSEKFGIIRLKKYSISHASVDLPILVIHQPECLFRGADVRRIIGHPQSLNISPRLLFS